MASVFILRDMADRLEGKVTQQLDLTGDVFLTLAERIAKGRQQVADRAKNADAEASRLQ
jgi:hypothetical protein